MSEKMLNHVRSEKPDYMNRSVHIEQMYWEGVRAVQKRAEKAKKQVS